MAGVKEPYRIFFPLGVFAAFIGVLSWIPFAFGFTLNYPGTEHPHLMIGGFLYSFTLGFLMTAIPRFTGTVPASAMEQWAQFTIACASICLGALSFLWPEMRAFGLACQIVSVLLLSVFLVRRFVSKERSLPPPFLFVGIGVFCALMGSACLFLEELNVQTFEFGTIGKTLFYHGMMLSLVIGVGTRLVPVLLGHAANPLDPKAAGPTPAFRKLMLALACLYGSTFLIEFGIDLQWGRVVRAAILTLVVLKAWKILQSPKRQGAQTLWIRLAAVFLLLGQWHYALLLSYGVHGAHLTFAGGFSILTLMIATRVILSHGGYDLMLEQTSKSLHWVGGLISIAAFARFLAPLTPKSYLHHLGYASVAWAVGVGLWATIFLPKIWARRPS